MSKELGNWLLFIVLSLIWGSSFILMKIGMESLTDFQVASLRIVSAGIVLLPLTVRHIRSIPLNKIGYIFLSGILGNLLPSYLFCIAETRVDSALAGTLNALTPIFAIITGFLIFKFYVPSKKVIGIIIAFGGSIFLMFGKGMQDTTDVSFSLLIVLATFLYGINVNLAKKYLNDVGSLKAASVALSLSAIPALIVLIFTGYFQIFTRPDTLIGTLAASTLGVMGTAIATILFYMLIKRAGVLFTSMVTYGIPFVAIGWGFVYNEDIGWKQIVSLFIILTGVYIANRSGKTVAVAD
ncbi:MAG TPA: DMT family transporter [Hanamia sp.]|nr:DMT family transporter [Hanamia sp.]